MCVEVLRTPDTRLSPPGDDVRELLVLPDADHGDEVDVAGAGVDLRDAVEVRDGLGGLGDVVGVGVDQHEGRDQRALLVARAAAPVRCGPGCRGV